MVLIEYVPVKIVETGEEVITRIKIDPLEQKATCIELESCKIDDCDTCLIEIGSKMIPFVLTNIEEDTSYRTLVCRENLSYVEWRSIIYNAIQGIAMKQFVEEWTDMYRQRPIEKYYLTDTQKNRLHKLLVKEIDKYFHSGKTRMSYADVIKIEEIIVNVLNGE